MDETIFYAKMKLKLWIKVFVNDFNIPLIVAMQTLPNVTSNITIRTSGFSL